MAGDEACPHVTMLIHQGIQLRLEATFSWIQEDILTASQLFLLCLPSLPSLGQSKAALFCFDLLFLVVVVAAMKRKCKGDLKIIWALFCGSNTSTKILCLKT